MLRFLVVSLFVLLFPLALSADFLRVEGGAGVFQASPGGTFDAEKGGAEIDLKDAGIDTESDLYLWAYLKHPLPLIPNVRLEYLSLAHSPEGNATAFDVNELDGILYYNLLDDTLFVTVDVGVDIKYIASDSKGFDDSQTIGLLYARGRIEPTTSLGFEMLLKATNYGDNKGYDLRIKADYTLDFIPLVQPGLELGYRIHKIEYAIGDYINKGEYSGVYGGLMIRF